MESRELDLLEKKLLQNQRMNVKFQTIYDIDMMTGQEFEKFIAQLFDKMGYKTEVTKGSGDQGIDVIVERMGKKIGIQTKCYSKEVSNKAIQEVVAGIHYYNLDKGMVITNRYYTTSAMDLAEKNNILLWDRFILPPTHKSIKIIN